MVGLLDRCREEAVDIVGPRSIQTDVHMLRPAILDKALSL